MKTIKNKLILFLLSLIIIYSCKNGEKNSNKKTNGENIEESKIDTLEQKRWTTLFSFDNQNANEVVEISGTEASDEDKYFLASDKNIILISKYRKNDKGLDFIKNDTLLLSEYKLVAIDKNHTLKKTIQGKDYFLFSVKEIPMGNGYQGKYLSFFIVNISNLKFYRLQYSGENTLRSGDDFIDGKFTENKVLDANPIFKNELYQFAEKSKLIYKPTEEEKDIFYYTNFEHKWYKDNYPGGAEIFYPEIVRSTYYTEDLFKFNGNYDKDQVIENANFKIVTYFRNNIIGYDKNKELYFPITVESCATGCEKDIKFVSENEIEISYGIGGQESDTIDLHKIKFANNPRLIQN